MFCSRDACGRKLSQVNSCIAWICLLTNKSNVTVSGEYENTKRMLKRPRCFGYWRFVVWWKKGTEETGLWSFVTAVDVEACHVRKRTRIVFLGSPPKLSWALLLKTHLQWVWKRTFVFVTASILSMCLQWPKQRDLQKFQWIKLQRNALFKIYLQLSHLHVSALMGHPQRITVTEYQV